MKLYNALCSVVSSVIQFITEEIAHILFYSSSRVITLIIVSYKFQCANYPLNDEFLFYSECVQRLCRLCHLSLVREGRVSAKCWPSSDCAKEFLTSPIQHSRYVTSRCITSIHLLTSISSDSFS